MKRYAVIVIFLSACMSLPVETFAFSGPNIPREVPFTENNVTYTSYIQTWHPWYAQSYICYFPGDLDSGQMPVIADYNQGPPYQHAWIILNPASFSQAWDSDAYHSNALCYWRYSSTWGSPFIPTQVIQPAAYTWFDWKYAGPTGYDIREDLIRVYGGVDIKVNFSYDWNGQFGLPNLSSGDYVLQSDPVATPLSFPLQTECSPGVLCTPYTAPISSVFDHSMATAYSENETVVAFTGDSGVRGSGYWYGCYRKADSSAFDFYGYTGANGTSYLCYDGHPAIDYDVDVGTAVYSAASGTVLEANYDNCLGYYVRIQHDDGYTTLYAHLDSINTNNVMVGELIQANVQIGESGNTGTCSSGSHLHFEVRLNNVPVDPYGWEGGGDDPYTQAVNIPLW